MHSPYFQTEHYKEENPGGKIEQKIEKRFLKIKKKILTLLKR
jgi:hypothetical protein